MYIYIYIYSLTIALVTITREWARAIFSEHHHWHLFRSMFTVNHWYFSGIITVNFQEHAGIMTYTELSRSAPLFMF